MTGLFYVLIALGIVFVVWGYANEEKLIAFEDKMMVKIRRKFGMSESHTDCKKQAEYNKSARVDAVRKQQRKDNRRRPFSADMPRTAA